jgi:hypothetical protein
MPGFLIPADIPRIASFLGYTNLGQFARECLMASPGSLAKDLITGKVFRIPTLTPQAQPNGACKFLTAEGRCSIHAVSPYGCAFYDSHEPIAVANKKTLVALRVISESHQREEDYSLLWYFLHSRGIVAAPVEERRRKLRAALDAEGITPSAC